MSDFLKNMLIGLFLATVIALFLATVLALMFSGTHYLFGNKTDKPETRIVEVDGHEYIIMTFSSFPEGKCLAHKADCRFCKKEKQ